MIESTLNKIAERILNLDEASLAGLWDKYKGKMEHFDATKEWEKAVIIFFIINAVRAKNYFFNEQIMSIQKQQTKSPRPPKGKPHLRIVK